jgi:predicted ATP-grasp superfamily ATP-dependent carboligase
MSAVAGAPGQLGVDTSTPILVLRRSVGAFQHCALAIARSAGRLGIPVFSVRHDRREPATSSRYLRDGLALSPSLPDAEWVQALLELRSELGKAILLPIDDLAAVLVGDHQDRLAESFLLPAAPRGVQRLLASKRELWRLCGELGLPSPDSSFPTDETELVEQAEARGYPVVLKRADPWLAPRDPAAPSVSIVRTREALLREYARMESEVAPQVMVQEYIPGDSDSIWMFDGYVGAAGDCLCAFTGRKLRQRGPRAGPTTLGICADNPEVSDLAQRLLGAIGYRGIVDMGFRYDARDGTYRLLDVNPRLGSTFRLFAADNGIDVVRALHLDLTGRPVPASATATGRKWLDERSDAATAVRLAQEGTLGPRGYARSLRGVRESAWWAADDPLPFLLMGVRSVPQAVNSFTGGRWS